MESMNEMLSSRWDRAIEIVNAQKQWLHAQDLYKVKQANIPALMR